MRNVWWALFVFTSIGALYYLFIRPFEYEVTMKAQTVPGDVIGTIRIWSRSLPNASISEVDSLKSLKQHVVWSGGKYSLTWNFNSIHDSLTKINVWISQPGRRFLNKILIPFTEQQIERDAAAIMHQFHSILKSHLSVTRVKVLGETVLDSSFCVCRTVKTVQIEKAKGMMRDYPLLTSFVDKFQIKPDGPPMVNVRKWDHSTGQLEFDFCFPIAPSDSLPHTQALVYRQFGQERVLKAEYHGNYITSDRAWYELLHYAHKHGYKIDGLPIEYFYNNPNTGLNERNWKAEVFLPIAN